MKQAKYPLVFAPGLVAPFTGAWIETFWMPTWIHDFNVAPFTGAWIETGADRDSHTRYKVAPFTGAWIETDIIHGEVEHSEESHPSRVRGLKQPSNSSRNRAETSHPSRVRGLKLLVILIFILSLVVAPFTGAWIETLVK